MSLTGKFGDTANCKCRPWQYSQRLAIAQQVADFKRKIPNHLAVKTKRSKVTQFIAGKKSRQEFKPFTGKLCDKEVVQPLHIHCMKCRIYGGIIKPYTSCIRKDVLMYKDLYV